MATDHIASTLIENISTRLSPTVSSNSNNIVTPYSYNLQYRPKAPENYTQFIIDDQMARYCTTETSSTVSQEHNPYFSEAEHDFITHLQKQFEEEFLNLSRQDSSSPAVTSGSEKSNFGKVQGKKHRRSSKKRSSLKVVDSDACPQKPLSVEHLPRFKSSSCNRDTTKTFPLNRCTGDKHYVKRRLPKSCVRSICYAPENYTQFIIGDHSTATKLQEKAHSTMGDFDLVDCNSLDVDRNAFLLNQFENDFDSHRLLVLADKSKEELLNIVQNLLNNNECHV